MSIRLLLPQHSYLLTVQLYCFILDYSAGVKLALAPSAFFFAGCLPTIFNGFSTVAQPLLN